ncbi:class I SAM-dependent methyltransferase [Candidatus Dependentiae bacterium]|nr:class I SAM-dependent methyltransferase [Candidatus Dependentiae bacterium]
MTQLNSRNKFKDDYSGKTSGEHSILTGRHKLVYDIFSKKKSDSHLDIGCGDGNFTKLIGSVCGVKKLCGIETSDSGLKSSAANNVQAVSLKVDEEKFPFPDNCFDSIYAGAIIEHLFNTDFFFEQTYRVLKPGGLFVVDTPNLASIYNRISLLFGFQPFDTHISLKYPIGHITESSYRTESELIPGSDHIRPFTFKGLKLLLLKNNFKIIKFYGINDVVNINNYFIRTILNSADFCLKPFPSLNRIALFAVTK